MSFPAINPHRTVLRASVDGAPGRGLHALGLFYSLVLNFGHHLLPMVEMGRALWARCARLSFCKIGGLV